MTLSDLSIKRPTFAWVLMFALIFFGILSFTKLGINENPDVEYPTVTIRYTFIGATPEVIEKDIIEPVEGILVTMGGIRSMTSEAERGGADIRLEFGLDQDIDVALQEINTLLTRAQRELPGNLDPPSVTKNNADDDPILRASLTSSSLSFRELMILFRDRVRDQISIVDGVAEVRAYGFHEPMMRINLDAKKLKQYRLTVPDIVSSIQREHQELPAGRLENEERERLLRMMGEVETAEEFENLVISRRGGSPNYQRLTLRDVATIEEGTENIRRYSRVNGIPSLGIAIQKQRGVNAVETADRVKEKVRAINSSLPEGTSLDIGYDSSKFIKESINDLLFTLILSAILTSLVCWLFIGSFSASINILLAIPTSIIGSFIFLHLFGLTLNSFSLLGLALAIGVVVDDAVVMLENIIRYIQLGFDRVRAAILGAREITFAVLATTVALVAIFIPITLIDGIEGRFFFEFALTISIAVCLSSLEALTLAPMRCSKFLRIGERATAFGRNFDRALDWLREKYLGSLKTALKHRKTVAGASLSLFAASLSLVWLVPKELEPPQDRGAMFVIFIAPEGSSLNYTDSKIREFEKIAMAHPDVEDVVISVGGFGQGGEGNRGNGVLVLKDRSERDRSQFEIASELRKQVTGIEGIQTIIRDRFGSPLSGRRGSPIEFTISGPSSEVQRELYKKMEARMEADPIITGVRSNDVDLSPELHFVPDRKKAAARGVEISQIAEVINTSIGGTSAAEYNSGGRRFDVFVQLQEGDRRKEADIRDLFVRNNRGELVPLPEVVTLEEAFGPQEIYREDRIRGVRVDAAIEEGGTLGDVVEKIRGWEEELFPEKYFIKFESAPTDKLLDALLIMALGLLVAYLVLAVQFNSFADPALVFLAVPFGMTGSLLGLWIFGQSLNLYSAIGILLTMGIVKKNSILLVEFTNKLRDQGRSTYEAIVRACQTRLRPILMTNVATIAAALPPALGFGPGSETRIPMALAVIGGVLVSVIFTVFVVPCVYSLVERKRPKEIDPKDVSLEDSLNESENIS